MQINNEFVLFAVFAAFACFVAILAIVGILLAGRNIRESINRENELQRERMQKEIELMQAQIDYYNEQNNKTTSNNT